MKSLFNALIIVFKDPKNVFLSVVTAVAIFVILSWLPNISLIRQIIFDPDVELPKRLFLLISIPYGYFMDLSFRSNSSVAISLLLGINITLIHYYIRMYRAGFISAISAMSTGSLLAGIVGLGCASCGSIIAAGIASVFSTSAALVLPLQGTEFTIISFVLVTISTIVISNKISSS